MKFKMKKCKSCGIYTMENKCPKCNGDLNVIYPPKYSIEDKYGKYRRKLKKELLIKENKLIN
jgi:H/ACA ribonucleoprotein complex subunit 3